MTRKGFWMQPLTVAIAFAATSLSGQAQGAPKAAGHWEGTVQYGNPPLSFAIDLSKDASGAWIGSFSVPGSTTAGIPLTNLSVSDAGLSFSINVGDVATLAGGMPRTAPTLTRTASSSRSSRGFRCEAHG